MNTSDLAITYKDQTIHLNPRLIAMKALGVEEVQQIKQLHLQRMALEDAFVRGEVDASDYRQQWQDNQFDLQKAWKFPADAKFHRFWDMAGCSCPRLDNEDNYPHGYYVYSGSCKVHGDMLKK